MTAARRSASSRPSTPVTRLRPAPGGQLLGDTADPGQATCTNYRTSRTLQRPDRLPAGSDDHRGLLLRAERRGHDLRHQVPLRRPELRGRADGKATSPRPTSWPPRPSTDQSGNHWVAQSRAAYDSYGRVDPGPNSGGYPTIYTYSSGVECQAPIPRRSTRRRRRRCRSPLTSSTACHDHNGIYAGVGHPVDVIDPSGLRTDYAYDALGDVTDSGCPGRPDRPARATALRTMPTPTTSASPAPSAIETTTLTGPARSRSPATSS